jgi:putative membrane protein
LISQWSGRAGLVLVSGCLLGLGCATGQTPMIDQGSNLMLKSPDIKFLTDMSLAAAGQMELGKLAVAKSSDPDVQAFGRHLADEYSAMVPKLTNIAATKRMTLPSDLTARDLSLHHKIENLSSPRFDRTYMKAMVKQNAKRVKSFKKEIKHGRDPAIQSFASETFSAMEGDLEKARSLRQALKGKRS